MWLLRLGDMFRFSAARITEPRQVKLFGGDVYTEHWSGGQRKIDHLLIAERYDGDRWLLSKITIDAVPGRFEIGRETVRDDAGRLLDVMPMPVALKRMQEWSIYATNAKVYDNAYTTHEHRIAGTKPWRGVVAKIGRTEAVLTYTDAARLYNFAL